MARDSTSLLYGADDSPGLVGCAATQAGMALWWRRGAAAGGSGGVEREDITFAPGFLLSHPHLLDQFKPSPRLTTLSGGNHFTCRAEFETWKDAEAALSEVNKYYRANKSQFEAELTLAFGDPVVQYLLISGRTHYKGLNLDDLHVLFITLRAYNSGGADYADPAVPEDGIVMLGLSDGKGWEQVLGLEGEGEKELIEALGAVIAERDPDVIAGHDIYKHTLSYLAARAKRFKLALGWGRDGSNIASRRSQAPAAEKTLEYPRADIAGRSIVDTWFLTQYYDIVKRDLERYDAPYVARYLDHSLSAEALPDPVPAWDYDQLYDHNRAALAEDLRGELRAAALIHAALCGSFFAQAQMLPYSLQDCIVRGNGVKINQLLMREYLRRGESIPAPVETRTIIGGYTALRRTGLIRDVLNVDMASLYPSIMLKHGVKPATDTGGVFQPLLAELTRQRLAAKELAKTSSDARERVLADARQGAFKIFINSFFGYLGTNRLNWADPNQAEFITTTGQALVNKLAGIVEGLGGSVIEIDTDGVYFTMPEGYDLGALEAQINAGLPEGIRAELGEPIATMLSYKVKNYALLFADGSIIVKGASMKSRGLEPFLHSFIQESIGLILRGEQECIPELCEALRARIKARQMDIRELAKTDTLIESLEIYKQKTGGGGRNRAAAYEVALKSRRQLRAGDQVSYYITGEKAAVKAFEAAKPLREYDAANPDYNIAYYDKKCLENLKKVQGFLSGDSAAEATGSD